MHKLHGHASFLFTAYLSGPSFFLEKKRDVAYFLLVNKHKCLLELELMCETRFLPHETSVKLNLSFYRDGSLRKINSFPL